MASSEGTLVESFLDVVVGQPADGGADEACEEQSRIVQVSSHGTRDKVAWNARVTGDQHGSSLAAGEAVGLFKDVDDGSYKEAIATRRVRIVVSQNVSVECG